MYQSQRIGCFAGRSRNSPFGSPSFRTLITELPVFLPFTHKETEGSMTVTRQVILQRRTLWSCPLYIFLDWPSCSHGAGTYSVTGRKLTWLARLQIQSSSYEFWNWHSYHTSERFCWISWWNPCGTSRCRPNNISGGNFSNIHGTYMSDNSHQSPTKSNRFQWLPSLFRGLPWDR